MDIPLNSLLSLSRSIVTIDFDNSSVRILEVKGNRITKWGSVALEPGIIEDGIIINQQAFISSIKQLMGTTGIKGGRVIASISGLYSVNRILTVPRVPRESVTLPTLLEAARDTMSLDEDTLDLSWQIITGSELNQQAFIVGIPRDRVDAEVAALRTARMKPTLLSLKTMALARLVNRDYALILNLEPGSYNIIAVVHGIPEIMRTILFPGDDSNTDDNVESIATNMELAVDFINTQYPDIPLNEATPLFITGCLSEDAILMQGLSSRLKYPLDKLQTTLHYSEELPVSEYAVNIGLGLIGAASSRKTGVYAYRMPDINLLPARHRAWKPTTRQLYFSAGTVTAVILLSYLYQVTGAAMSRTSILQTKYNVQNSELQARQEEIRDRVPLQNAINEYSLITNMDSGLTEDLAIINMEAESLGVHVQSIVREGKKLAVTCKAQNYVAFRSYVTALKENGRFSSVIPPGEGYERNTEGTIELQLASTG